MTRRAVALEAMITSELGGTSEDTLHILDVVFGALGRMAADAAPGEAVYAGLPGRVTVIVRRPGPARRVRYKQDHLGLAARSCEHCGAIYKPRAQWQRYCSPYPCRVHAWLDRRAKSSSNPSF